MIITLNEVEDVYQKRIQAALNDDGITPELLAELSLSLYQEVKVEGLSDIEDNDMILFEYGTWNWNNALGTHFSLSLARQFIITQEYEPYQLHFHLIYDPKPFEDIRNYNCWSLDFKSPDDFFAHIKTTDGFKMAEKHTPKTMQVFFEKC